MVSSMTDWINSYRKRVGTESVMGHRLKTQSDLLMNNTFTRDPNYRKVYILTKDGWKWEDAKYQIHSAPSIVKDAVDYYLQFRPKVHYPIGSYVIVPDDTSFDVNLTKEELEQPFTQPIENRTQWWIIVGRDESPTFVRYMILKCDWEFRWIYKNRIMTCWACSKTQQSYNSGVWRDDISISQDNMTASWLPDPRYTYGDMVESLGLCDTRTIVHGQRFFMSNNELYPKIYEVTKITDINPQGIIKVSVKQDEFNEKRDNIELRICDYYTDEGDINITIPDVEIADINKWSRISWLEIDEYGELVDGFETELELGEVYYFGVKFSSENIDPQWEIQFVDDYDEYSDEDKEYYLGLMKLTKFDTTTLALKPAKASSLRGKIFELTVSDINGEYKSVPIRLEVAE